ncbi:MAG: hypothetical protein ACLSA6_07755 [Holdemania massiliensis]
MRCFLSVWRWLPVHGSERDMGAVGIMIVGGFCPQRRHRTADSEVGGQPVSGIGGRHSVQHHDFLS